MAPQLGAWRPMNREQFRQLRPGQALQERRGPTWTVHATYQKHGLAHAVLVVGSRVRHVSEHFCDDYMLLEPATPAS